MPRPTIRAAGAVALGAAVYAYGSTSEVSWLFLVAYWCWALVVAAFVYAAWAARGVTAELEVVVESAAAELPSGMAPGGVFEGDALQLRARLYSRGAARGPARLSGAAGGVAVDVAVAAATRAGTGVEHDLGSARRGVVGLTGGRLEVADPAGFFRVSRSLPARELALVLPRFAELEDARRADEVEDALAAHRAGSGVELFGAREYRPGDPLRRIHWRLSARRPGALVVREYEPPGRRSLLVALDQDPLPEAADQAARIAASEAWTCVRQGGRVALWAPGREATGADLWQLLEWLARWPVLPESDAAPPRAADAVAVTTDGSALAALMFERVRPAGAWLVGDAAPEPAIPARRAGLEWPL